ncbi:hypothetical protein ACJX0J_031256, partial [Zea mays]
MNKISSNSIKDGGSDQDNIHNSIWHILATYQRVIQKGSMVLEELKKLYVEDSFISSIEVHTCPHWEKCIFMLQILSPSM